MIAVGQPNSTTVNDYLAGEEISETKHEYIGGTVHAVAGATNQHNSIATSALLALGSQLRRKSCQSFNSDTKVRIEFPDHTRFYYPDAMVVSQTNPATDQFQNQPVVIIEILSDSTRRADLGEKRDAYLTISSLKALLFVEPDFPAVTLHRRMPEGGFASECHTGIEAVIALPEIEATLALSDLYERVEFSA